MEPGLHGAQVEAESAHRSAMPCTQLSMTSGFHHPPRGARHHLHGLHERTVVDLVEVELVVREQGDDRGNLDSTTCGSGRCSLPEAHGESDTDEARDRADDQGDQR